MEETQNINEFLRWEKVAAEAGADEALVLPQADTLSDQQHERIGKMYMLVCLMKAKTPTREAIKRARLNITVSAAHKVLKRYERHGVRGIIDQRFGNRRKKKVLSDALKKRVLAWWFSRPAAGPRAIWKELVKECNEHGVAAPGYDTVKKYIKSLPEAYKLFRKGKIGVHEWERNLCPVVRFDLTTYSNQRWQIDNSRLDFWVRVKYGNRWIPAQVHLSACMCAHSRSIPGFILSATDPDAWTTALLIMKSVAPKENPQWRNKGLPSILQPDRGSTFLAHAVITSLAYLGVAPDPDPPYYPNRKGKLERWFLTLDRGCLRILPGHMDAIGRTREAAEKHVPLLLTVPQLRKEIERWIVEDYHQHIHSETGRKPCELWEETVRMDIPESEDALHLLLLKNDKERTVKNTGIRFKFYSTEEEEDHVYWAPELTYHTGERVTLRYNPEDHESILVYSVATNQYICEAWLMGHENSRYTIADIKQARSNFRRGLKERLKEYISEIEREDRKRASEAEWEEARRTTNALEESSTHDGNTGDPDLLLNELLDQFHRQDDGKSPNQS